MYPDGITLCARYAFPPNSLSLCGPENKKSELKYYSSNIYKDRGLTEILSHFSTLFPYLVLIAGENNIKDPFDKRVVEAYWLGNKLLNKVNSVNSAKQLSESMGLKKKLNKKKYNKLFSYLPSEFIPHHSSHVINIYIRTGNVIIPHVIETMDACIINSGKVISVSKKNIRVITRKLQLKNNTLVFSKLIEREILPADIKDRLVFSLKPDDIISFHWGMLCQKISLIQAKLLYFYTNLSLTMANKYKTFYE